MPICDPPLNREQTFSAGDRVTLHPQVARPGMRRNLRIVSVQQVPADDRHRVGHPQWVHVENPNMPVSHEGELFSGAWCFKEGTSEAEKASAW